MLNFDPNQFFQPVDTTSKLLDTMALHPFNITCPPDPQRERDHGMLEILVRSIMEDLEPIMPVIFTEPDKFPIEVRTVDGVHILTVIKSETIDYKYTLQIENEGLELLWDFESYCNLEEERIAERHAAGLGEEYPLTDEERNAIRRVIKDMNWLLRDMPDEPEE